MFRQRFVLTVVLSLIFIASDIRPAQLVIAQTVPAPESNGRSVLFIENAGQWSDAARFQVWGSPLGAGTTWLAEDAIWLVVGGTERESGSMRDEATVSPSPSRPLSPSPQTAIKLTFPGSNPDVRIEPFEPLTTTVSYLLGNDPEQWRPAVPVWGGVRYTNLYPGIDLIIGGDVASWRLDAQSGANPDQVQLRIEGADRAALSENLLQLTFGANDVGLPLLQMAGKGSAAAQVNERGALAFEVTAPFTSPSSPPQKPADNPTDLLYSTFLGGSNLDFDAGIAVDRAGRAYVLGNTLSNNFPTTPGVFASNLNNIYVDGFVVKLNPAGNSLVYATFLGGSSSDAAIDIAIDRTGYAYITGWTTSADFPATSGAFDTSFNGYYDGFVTKLDTDGSGLVYSTYLGGNRDEDSRGIAIDHSSRAYVTGFSMSTDFPTTPGSFAPNHSGGVDAFVVKFDLTGSSLEYATFLGGSHGDYGISLALDRTNAAYVTGYSGSPDFPTTSGTIDTTHNDGLDVFASKLSPSGDSLIYSTFLGGSADDYGNDIAVDRTNSAYLTGYTGSSQFPTTPNAYDTSFNGNLDVFVAKLSDAGDYLVYATLLGSTHPDYGYGIVVDRLGNAYITGGTYSTDFPTTPGAFDTSYNGGDTDAFVIKLSAAGDTLLYSTFLGHDDRDFGGAITIDPTDNVYASGDSNSAGFPTTPGAFDTVQNGGSDAYIAKLNIPYIAQVVAPIDQPVAGAYVNGLTTLRGFAIDLASFDGTGIDRVHILLHGDQDIGSATYGFDRPDIADLYGARFAPSGWELTWNFSGLSIGAHNLVVYAHRTADDSWTMLPPHKVFVAGAHQVWVPMLSQHY